MKYFVSFALMCLYVCNAGAVSYSNTTQPARTGTGGMDMEKIQTISILENDIAILDTEIAKCEKSKKGWIAATVIGSAGVVATGVAAGVQGAKISKKKQDLADYEGDVAEKQKTLTNLQRN